MINNDPKETGDESTTLGPLQGEPKVEATDAEETGADLSDEGAE